MLRGGFLHTTGERGEGYIAYKLIKYPKPSNENGTV